MQITLAKAPSVQIHGEMVLREGVTKKDVDLFFFIFVAAPKGVQGYVFIGLNQFTYHHRSNRSRWPGLVQLGAPPSPRLESQLLAVRGGRGVVVKMEAL